MLLWLVLLEVVCTMLLSMAVWISVKRAVIRQQTLKLRCDLIIIWQQALKLCCDSIALQMCVRLIGVVHIFTLLSDNSCTTI